MLSPLVPPADSLLQIMRHINGAYTTYLVLKDDMKWNHRWLLCISIFNLLLISGNAGADDQTFDGCQSPVQIAYCYKPDGKKTECYRYTGGWREEIRKIYNLYPKYLQRVMCSLDYIAIDGTMKSSGWAFCDREIAIKLGLFLFDLSLSEWATWKEQLPFSPRRHDYGHDADGLIVRARMDWDVNTAVAFILAHELGHIVDAKINATGTDSADNRGSLLWEDGTGLNLPRLCFYSCEEEPLVPVNIKQIFQQINASRFPSAYSTGNSREHFADTFAFYILKKYANLDYSVWYRGEELLNVTKRLESPDFRNIIAFMDGLEARLAAAPPRAGCPDPFGMAAEECQSALKFDNHRRRKVTHNKL